MSVAAGQHCLYHTLLDDAPLVVFLQPPKLSLWLASSPLRGPRRELSPPPPPPPKLLRLAPPSPYTPLSGSNLHHSPRPHPALRAPNPSRPSTPRLPRAPRPDLQVVPRRQGRRIRRTRPRERTHLHRRVTRGIVRDAAQGKPPTPRNPPPIFHLLSLRSHKCVSWRYSGYQMAVATW